MEKQLRCLYTNIRSLDDKREELELLVQEVKQEITEIKETWWNSRHDWNIGTEVYVLFGRDSNKGKGCGVALNINNLVN